MKRLLNQYSKRCRAGVLLVLVYSLHLFTFHALLANPDDFLSTNSFASHHSDPGSSTDYLMFLAKKETFNKSITIHKQVDFTSSLVANSLHKVQTFVVHFVSPKRLSENCFRRYSALQVFLI